MKKEKKEKKKKEKKKRVCVCARACVRVYVCVCACVWKPNALDIYWIVFAACAFFKLISVSIALFSFVVLVVLHTVMMIVMSWLFVVVVMVVVLSRWIYLLHFDFGNNLSLSTSFLFLGYFCCFLVFLLLLLFSVFLFCYCNAYELYWVRVSVQIQWVDGWSNVFIAHLANETLLSLCLFCYWCSEPLSVTDLVHNYKIQVNIKTTTRPYDNLRSGW